MSGGGHIGSRGSSKQRFQAQPGKTQLHLSRLDAPLRVSVIQHRQDVAGSYGDAALDHDGCDGARSLEVKIGAALGNRRSGQVDGGAQPAHHGLGTLRFGRHDRLVLLPPEEGRYPCPHHQNCGNQEQPTLSGITATDQGIDINFAHLRLTPP